MTFCFLWVANIHAFHAFESGHAVIWCHMQELGSVPVGDFTGFCGSEMVRSHRELQQLMYVTPMSKWSIMIYYDPCSLRSSLQETNVITRHVFGGIFSCILYDLYAFPLSELRLSRVAPISCLPSGSSPWYHARRSDGVQATGAQGQHQRGAAGSSVSGGQPCFNLLKLHIHCTGSQRENHLFFCTLLVI